MIGEKIWYIRLWKSRHCDVDILLYRSDDEKQPKRKKKFDEKQSYGCGYMKVRQAKREYFTTTWGPVGFSKENHPLQIMASGSWWDILVSGKVLLHSIKIVVV